LPNGLGVGGVLEEEKHLRRIAKVPIYSKDIFHYEPCVASDLVNRALLSVLNLGQDDLGKGRESQIKRPV